MALLSTHCKPAQQSPLPFGQGSSAAEQVGGGETQAPPTQFWSAAHMVPHVPQFELSVWVSTHVPPQFVCPAGQVQAPLWHVEPPVHAVPQVPQLLLSVWVSTQEPLQSVWPAGQPPVQVPPEQT